MALEKKPAKKSDGLQIRVTEKNLDKFKQVLLYVLNKVGGKPNIGETVLHKLLYFIDFDYYEKFEENLMGATYIKNHHGPTSIELGVVMKKMQEQGCILFDLLPKDQELILHYIQARHVIGFAKKDRGA